MTEETKTKEGEQKEALQLKRLLNPRKEELGDLTKWKHLDAGDMVLLNKLNAELTPQALDRINSMDEKQRKEGLSSIIVANYCSSVAKEHNKYDVANHIQSLIANQEMDAKEIGIYALEEMKNTLPSEKKMEAIAKGYLAKKAKGLEEKVDAIDIVVLPVTEDDAYVYVSNNKINDAQNIPINIYYTGKKDNKMVNAILSKADEHIRKDNEDYSFGMGMIGGICGGLGSALIGLIGGAIAEEVGANPLIPGLVTGLVSWASVLTITHYACREKPSKKAKRKAIKNNTYSKINWIESKDITEIYDTINSEKNALEAGYEHPVIKEAAEYIFNHYSGIDQNLKKIYKGKFSLQKSWAVLNTKAVIKVSEKEISKK
ncbi:MAG: hypothetical protein ABIB71_07905 [Candidatus Woesearchaeota archaeon]